MATQFKPINTQEELDAAIAERIRAETSKFADYDAWKDNGGKGMAQNNGKKRTLAFQISEEFFQRIKTYLEKESKRLGRKVTQRDFVLGLIEQALEEAERETARTEETAAGQSDGADARPEPGADSPNREPDAGDAEEADADSGESTENAPADAVEDADSADSLPTTGGELNAP